MIKRDEIADPTSCLNRAEEDEPLFVLRGADPCAKATIRYWRALAGAAGHRQEKLDGATHALEAFDRWPLKDPD